MAEVRTSTTYEVPIEEAAQLGPLNMIKEDEVIR